MQCSLSTGGLPITNYRLSGRSALNLLKFAVYDFYRKKMRNPLKKNFAVNKIF